MSYISQSKARLLDQTGFVELFELDFRNGEHLKLVNEARSDQTVSFDGSDYKSCPVRATGFRWGPLSDQQLPRLFLPVRIGSLSIPTNADMLIGAGLRRIVTLQTELDPPDGQGGGSCFAPESWEVLRIIRMDSVQCSLELGPPAQLLGAEIPRYGILRDICQHSYRVWDQKKARFDYSLASCPYQGTNYFNGAGEPVKKAAEDSCSRRLESGCKKRFSGALPFFGFPGAARP